jgi:glycosyltransferase involved in cell wall biosynthesis
MKVLHLNTNDTTGGAARAAYKLHQGLLKNSDDNTIFGPETKLGKGWALVKPEIDKLPLKIFNTNQDGPWSVNWFPTSIVKKINEINPDIINLHWIGNGMVSIRELGKIKKPIVWTMHDKWPFTGGFHLSSEYINDDASWLSKRILNQKIKSWKKLNLTMVSPSNWLAELAQKSILLKEVDIKVIPNGLDTQVFKPISKKIARNILNLPLDKKIILFGAMGATKNKNKGFDLLIKALHIFENGVTDANDYYFLIFGSSKPKKAPNFKINTNYLGKINDDITLSLIYSSANVAVIPSKQENLPYAVMESLSCGTPCVAFNIGGIPDMIDHLKNGYLARPYETDGLAKGIKYCLKNSEKLGENGRKKVVEEFTFRKQAKNYQLLYKSLLRSQ